jgi:hypothetical protein
MREFCNFKDAEELTEVLELVEFVTHPLFRQLAVTFDPTNPDKFYTGLFAWITWRSQTRGYSRDSVHALVDAVYDAADHADVVDGSGSSETSEA